VVTKDDSLSPEDRIGKNLKVKDGRGETSIKLIRNDRRRGGEQPTLSEFSGFTKKKNEKFQQKVKELVNKTRGGAAREESISEEDSEDIDDEANEYDDDIKIKKKIASAKKPAPSSSGGSSHKKNKKGKKKGVVPSKSEPNLKKQAPLKKSSIESIRQSYEQQDVPNPFDFDYKKHDKVYILIRGKYN
jgi:hypothetical protein